MVAKIVALPARSATRDWLNIPIRPQYAQRPVLLGRRVCFSRGSIVEACAHTSVATAARTKMRTLPATTALPFAIAATANMDK
jgi:hypothetical protein